MNRGILAGLVAFPLDARIDNVLVTTAANDAKLSGLTLRILCLGMLLGSARARGVADPGIHVSLSAGEGGVDMEIEVDYRGALLAAGDPLDEAQDRLSQSIVEGLCDHWDRPKPGLVRFFIKD